ncbi:MAG: flagellar basal body rod protein FlgB [Candidatus Zixiibacteriota bacterium]|nr:MAG: flagellar basal body rod protein FlgB [candidate division Zixibacteria bacterium]
MLIGGKIFDKAGIPLYERLLKVVSSSQKVTSANIANVSTPGYQKKQVNFKDEMKRLMAPGKTVIPQATNARHITKGAPRDIVKIKEIKDNDNSSGINNVDIEKEMMSLAEGQLMYEYGAKKLARTFGLLRAAIRGRSQ